MSANVWIWILCLVVVVLAVYIVILKFGCSGDGSCRVNRLAAGNAADERSGVSDETAAAIALALSLYNAEHNGYGRNGNGHNGNGHNGNGNGHHNGSHWNSKAFAMSELPERKRRKTQK